MTAPVRVLVVGETSGDPASTMREPTDIVTHVGTRHTIAGGLYPNDTKHLAYWIKNASLMKPGSKMPALGKGETDRNTKMVMNVGGLTDAEIADIVAYLQALK